MAGDGTRARLDLTRKTAAPGAVDCRGGVAGLWSGRVPLPVVPFRRYDENRARCDVEQAVRHAAEKQSADGRQATGSHHDQVRSRLPGHVHNLVCGASPHVAPNDQRRAQSFLRELGRQLLESSLDFSLVSAPRHSNGPTAFDTFNNVHDGYCAPGFSR